MFAASKTASVSGGYQISRSLRFNSADSAYLNRTPATTTNQRTWTFSAWIKRSKLSTNQRIFQAREGTTGNQFFLRFSSDNTIYITGSSGAFELQTTQLFRDPSAWYHIVFACDTTQATSTNRFKLYINGSQVTAFGTATYPSQNLDTTINSAFPHGLGAENSGPSEFYDGYMTEVNLIDGQALTPSSFGETSATTGVWQPKAFAGTYGTNGFYLNFSDNSNTTAATLGKDYSGNGNNWTPNNFSVTAGAGNDSFVDSPTSYGTDTGAGGTVRGNYCTLNPLNKSGGMTLSDGNLRQSMDSATGYSARGTIAVSSGKWYAEAFVQNTTTQTLIGVCDVTLGANQDPLVSPAKAVAYYGNSGAKFVNASSSSYGATWTTGDTIGIALDMDALTVTFYKNNSSQGSIGLATTDLSYTFFGQDANSLNTQLQWNFGQRPFAYTAPSGYKALCTQNLPTPTIGATTATLANKYFDINLWTGNGSSQTITNSGGFQPDWVWAKGRSNATSNVVVNAITGANQFLLTDSTQAEATQPALVSAFTSSGFSIGNSTSINNSSSTYVGWQWKANGSGSSNTSGTITSTVSANTTSGFSVVTYTGNGTNNSTLGHGLGVAPSMIIFFDRNTAGRGHFTYHISTGANGYIFLNATDAFVSGNTTMLNGTAPSSSLITLGTNACTNGSTETYVAYCFAEVAGYSKFGSYTGNGSTDGPFVYTGFRPAYIMLKRATGATGNWWVYDSTRDTYNIVTKLMYANLSNAEDTFSALDLLSNGFKIRATNTDENADGSTYIYMCFASNPFKYSLAR